VGEATVLEPVVVVGSGVVIGAAPVLDVAEAGVVVATVVEGGAVAAIDVVGTRVELD
jgi:hypothetical protein